jgi:hypothetical protein
MRTTNYALSKKLAEMGFVGESETLKHDPDNFIMGQKYWSYDFETIWDALPAEISNYKYLGTTGKNPLVLILEKSNKHRPIYYTFSDVGGSYFGGRIQDGDCLADTAARLLITLAEQKIIKFK